MKIFCVNCNTKVEARLTDGDEIYPHRLDLADLPFWVCECGNYVGCHHKTEDPTRPLGVIPSPELRRARQKVHKQLDPIWKSGKITRSKLYKVLSHRLGWRYHTAEIVSVEQAHRVGKVISDIAKELRV